MIFTEFQTKILSMRIEWAAAIQKCARWSPVDHLQLFLPSHIIHNDKEKVFQCFFIDIEDWQDQKHYFAGMALII